MSKRHIRIRCVLPLTLLLSLGSATAYTDDRTDALKFRSIGPAVMGGRIDTVAVVEDEPSIIYIGTASGGVWKSTNMGTTWKSLFDGHNTSSIGDVALSHSDPDAVWVGTGEPNNRQSSSFGNGVYKSVDGGESFEHVGLEGTEHIGKIVVHPSRPERVYVAASGALWHANEERGVFRTIDGGHTWEKVLFIDEDTGVTTLAMDPQNPDVLYAAAYQRRRTPWGFNGGGPGSGLYKTTDGGDHWRRLDDGLPEGDLGRIGVAIYRADSRILYALIEHATEAGLYRTTNRGEHWEKVNELNPRPMYYSKIFIDPTDPDRVYVLGSSFHMSDDGGASFTTNRDMTPSYDVGVHGDHHTLWIDPENPKHLVLGGDGGLYLSWDRAFHWRKVNNISLGQFYGIGVDMDEPYNIYAGAQDTHSWMGPSATRNQIGILNGDWRQINFGDGMYQQVDPTDSSIVYTESQGGNIVRLDRRSGDRKTIKPYPEEGGSSYRFHWTSPILISLHDAKTIFLGGNRLFISDDRGDSWRATEDLTRNEDRGELAIMGVLPDEGMLSRHDGVGAWGTITTISESPTSAGTLYVGTDDGRIQLTRDGGESWESLEGNIRDFDPMRAKVSRVVASASSPSRAYASFDRHHLGDFEPYIFVTDDFGRVWRRLDTAFPRKAGWVNVVIEHPRNPDLLFAGTETGLFVTMDGGASWARMEDGFPTVPVDDLVIHPRDNDLVVGTHGRSIYILDDLTPLEQHDVQTTSPEIFEPRDATLFLPWKHESYGAQAQFIGQNPEFGALLSYYLPAAVDGPIEIVVKDTDGVTIRVLDGGGSEGFHRVAWDLRTDAPKDVPRGQGALVPTGRYTAELGTAMGGQRASFTVVLDPRLAEDIGTAELGERFAFQNESNVLRERLGGEVARAQKLSDTIAKLEALLEDPEDAALREALKGFETELAEARKAIGGGPRSFRNPNLLSRASRLFGELSGDAVRQGTLHAPTTTQRRRLAEIMTEADKAIAALHAIVDEALPSLNERLTARGPLRLGK
ncbi:MAG: hypothetical protein E2P02_11155 [Acidobacteria bacterium]|nr:MAG: hypothetical protein E2P02_11155 [Acidobacteriota bacterium]